MGGGRGNGNVPFGYLKRSNFQVRIQMNGAVREMARYKITLVDTLSNAEPEVFEAAKFVINDGWVQMLDGYNSPITIIRESEVMRIDRLAE